MIKGWKKFNEDIVDFDDSESRYDRYIRVQQELINANIPQVKKVIDDVRDCFISYEDMDIIKGYHFGGLYDPDKRSTMVSHKRESFSQAFKGEPSEREIENISEFFVPKYWGEFINRFISISVNYPYDRMHVTKNGYVTDVGWIGEEGIDILSDLIEAKSRLKDLGYKMEICFWKSKTEPLEIRVYFDMVCEWPDIYSDRTKED